MKPIASIVIVALLAALALGCGRQERAMPSPEHPLVAHLNTNETLIGRPVLLRAAVTAPADAEVTWPDLGAPPGLVVRTMRDERAEGVRVREWELIALRPGIIDVWTGRVQVAHAHGSTDERPVPPLELTVRLSIAETNLVARDIAGLERWPETPWTRLLLALGAVAALALLAAAVVLAFRRARKPAPPAPPLPPHERALRALRQLRAKGLPDAEGVDAFYVDLSAIIRRYLEDAFGLRAPEQTTEEFIRAATTSNKLALDHQQLVAAFLEQSDLVKFARYRPATHDMEAAYAAAERLVTETMPRPTPPAAPPGARPV